MRAALIPHPDTPCPWISDFKASLVRSAEGLTLQYGLLGELRDLRAPRPDPNELPGVRRDGLWATTCFEAFIQPAGSASYVELNLAPSGDWAAYRFSGYRRNMSPANGLLPQIATRGGLGWFELEASIAVAPGALPEGPWQAALTAVIESVRGEKSYWSIAHTPGKPDFHHADGFMLDVDPPA